MQPLEYGLYMSTTIQNVLGILSNLKQDIACGFGMETLSVLLKFHVVEMTLLFKVNEIGNKCGAATARSNLSWMNVLNMRSRISVCSQACLPSGCIIKKYCAPHEWAVECEVLQ